ncbi:hypothetical protein KC669_03395, partial [Candidatus Dojkabacteria bacterium]|nr:hypothetical protein [Candidatus Dojkabacteria bacterium]
MGDGTSTGGTYEGSFEQDSLEDVLSPEEKTQAEQNASEKMRRLLHQSLITLVFAAQAFLGVSKYADSQEFIGNWTDFQNRLELISSDPRLDNQDPNSRYYEDIHSLRNVTYEAEELIQDIKDVRLQDLTYSEYRGIQDNLMALGLVFGYGYDLNADGIFDGNIEQLSQGIDMLISEMKEI